MKPRLSAAILKPTLRDAILSVLWRISSWKKTRGAMKLIAAVVTQEYARPRKSALSISEPADRTSASQAMASMSVTRPKKSISL